MPEAGAAQPAGAQRLGRLPREAETPPVVRERALGERTHRKPWLLDPDPLGPVPEEEPQPEALLARMPAGAQVAGARTRLVDPVPEPRLVPPLLGRVERVRPLVAGDDPELGQL